MTNASIISVGTFAFCVLTMLGCDHPVSSGPPIEAGYIWPLTVGNVWVYDIQRYDTSGSVIESYIDSTIVTGTITVDGTTWYQLEGYTSGYFRNSPDGLVMGDPPYSEFLLLRFPANIGDSATFAGSYPVVVTSLTEAVAVKGQEKMAHTYEYRPQYTNSEITIEYCVPNLGRVKMISVDHNRVHILYRLTLIDHRLN